FARRVVGQALAKGGHAFNVAVGRPLTEWPAVRAALAWLHALAEMAAAEVVDAPTLGTALLAGHCAGDRSDGARLAASDARWRRKGLSHIEAAQGQRDSAGEIARRGDSDVSVAMGRMDIDGAQSAAQGTT